MIKWNVEVNMKVTKIMIQFDRKQRFSIRKYSVGTASVLLGTAVLGASPLTSPTVSASDEVSLSYVANYGELNQTSDVDSSEIAYYTIPITQQNLLSEESLQEQAPLMEDFTIKIIVDGVEKTHTYCEATVEQLESYVNFFQGDYLSQGYTLNDIYWASANEVVLEFASSVQQTPVENGAGTATEQPEQEVAENFSLQVNVDGGSKTYYYQVTYTEYQAIVKSFYGIYGWEGVTFTWLSSVDGLLTIPTVSSTVLQPEQVVQTVPVTFEQVSTTSSDTGVTLEEIPVIEQSYVEQTVHTSQEQADSSVISSNTSLEQTSSDQQPQIKPTLPAGSGYVSPSVIPSETVVSEGASKTGQVAPVTPSGTFTDTSSTSGTPQVEAVTSPGSGHVSPSVTPSETVVSEGANKTGQVAPVTPSGTFTDTSSTSGTPQVEEVTSSGSGYVSPSVIPSETVVSEGASKTGQVAPVTPSGTFTDTSSTSGTPQVEAVTSPGSGHVSPSVTPSETVVSEGANKTGQVAPVTPSGASTDTSSTSGTPQVGTVPSSDEWGTSTSGATSSGTVLEGASQPGQTTPATSINTSSISVASDDETTTSSDASQVSTTDVVTEPSTDWTSSDNENQGDLLTSANDTTTETACLTPEEWSGPVDSTDVVAAVDAEQAEEMVQEAHSVVATAKVAESSAKPTLPNTGDSKSDSEVVIGIASTLISLGLLLLQNQVQEKKN